MDRNEPIPHAQAVLALGQLTQDAGGVAHRLDVLAADPEATPQEVARVAAGLARVLASSIVVVAATDTRRPGLRIRAL